MAELGLRWRTMFGALAAGEDVSPALRLRTEGMMEAALLLGTDRGRLVAAMCECYRAAFGRSMEDDFGDDWEAFFPFPQIPAMARRAPVYPTTRD